MPNLLILLVLGQNHHRRAAGEGKRGNGENLAGCGEVHIAGEVHRFGPEQSVLLPGGVIHQIFNVGHEPLEITAVLTATPVVVNLPDGSELPLPWHS